MNRQHSLKPTLSVDLKKKRIRIHKVTLHLLGDPEYIQLLVNPLNHTIALRKSIQEDYLAHRIRKEQLTGKNCYELYSTDFVNTLCKVILLGMQTKPIVFMEYFFKMRDLSALT